MGIIIILISGVFFTFSSYFGKVVTNTTNMSGVINSFSRFFLGFILMIIYMLFNKKSFKAPNIKPIVLRAIFNSISIILFSMAYSYTTITNINMLHMTFPLFVILLAPYFTKKIIKKTTYLYLTVIMMGTYIVANPRLGNFNLGDFLALSSAIIAAFSIMYLTESRKRMKVI